MNKSRHHFCFQAMGGINEVIFLPPSNASSFDISNQLIHLVKALEEKYSRFKDSSIISKINAEAFVGPVRIDEETEGLLRYAEHCHKVSGCLFDITSGVLREVWNFGSKTIPSPNEIERVIKRIGFDKLRLERQAVGFSVKGMQIDLGGIAKEYAVDKAVTFLKDSGVTEALVNFAGDVHVFNLSNDARPWQIGIRHPRKDQAVLRTIPLVNGALATSGDYERFFIKDGARYCHIMNPLTGMPVTELQSVSVCASSCLVAGSLSTMAMLLGKEEGEELLKESGCPYLIVDGDGKAFGPL